MPSHLLLSACRFPKSPSRFSRKHMFMLAPRLRSCHDKREMLTRLCLPSFLSSEKDTKKKPPQDSRPSLVLRRLRWGRKERREKQRPKGRQRENIRGPKQYQYRGAYCISRMSRLLLLLLLLGDGDCCFAALLYSIFGFFFLLFDFVCFLAPFCLLAHLLIWNCLFPPAPFFVKKERT